MYIFRRFPTKKSPLDHSMLIETTQNSCIKAQFLLMWMAGRDQWLHIKT